MPAGSLIDRVLDLFDLLADFPRGLPVSEIARRLKCSKSEAFRVLGVMARRDFVAQDEETQRYRLSVRTAALAMRFFGGAGLAEVCQPILDRLAARTGELARLAVRDGEELYFVANAQGASSGLRFDPDLGRTPATLHATANGRAWLASLDEEEAVALVRGRGFTLPPGSLTSAVVDEPSLREALRHVRAEGYSVSVEETLRGIVTVAAPVGNRDGGAAVGCVSVAGPIFRLTPDRIAELMSDLKAAADQLSSVWPLPYRIAGTPPVAGELPGAREAAPKRAGRARAGHGTG